MSKPFTIGAIVSLIAVAALQVVRLASDGSIAINGFHLPPAASILILVAVVVLAFGALREMLIGSGGGDGTDDGVPSRGGTRAPGAARTRGARPVWQANGQRLPADYFMFASRGVSVRSIRGAAEKYERIMVGFDAGNIPDAAINAARAAGAELEIYVEGPGGPTGNSWSPDERARVKRASASVGVDTSKSDWMEEWDAWAWKAYTFKQLEEFMGEGYTAAEIDNLGRVLGEGTAELIDFYSEYGERCMAGHLPRLIMKNISIEQLKAVANAVEGGVLPRDMLAEFHISEKGAGYNRKKQDEVSSRIAVRTLPSNDTFNYDAYGEYGLGEQFAKLMPPPAPPAPTPMEVAPPQPGPATEVAVAAGPNPAQSAPVSTPPVAPQPSPSQPMPTSTS